MSLPQTYKISITRKKSQALQQILSFSLTDLPMGVQLHRPGEVVGTSRSCSFHLFVLLLSISAKHSSNGKKLQFETPGKGLHLDYFLIQMKRELSCLTVDRYS